MDQTRDQQTGTAVAAPAPRQFHINEAGPSRIEQVSGQAIHVQCLSRGYSGTKKLGHMLNLPEYGLYFKHEWYWNTEAYTGRPPTRLPFYDTDKMSVDEIRESYAAYINEVNAALSCYRVVGDAHGWHAHVLPVIDQILPVNAVIHLVRNGLRYAWSMLNWNKMDAGKPEHWQGRCRWWSHATRLYLEPDHPWSQDFPKPLRTYRIEDLTGETGTGTDTLNDLIRWLDPTADVPDEVLCAKQQGHVNKHDPKSEQRTLEWVWEQLTGEQRDIFIEECSEAMEAFGYEMPA